MTFVSGTEFGRGHIVDPPDVVARRPQFRHLASRLGLSAGQLPLSTNNRFTAIPVAKGGPGIRNQKRTQGCVGMACSTAVTGRYAILGAPLADPASPTQPYDLARDYERMVGADGTLPALEDTGTEPSQAGRGLMEFGVAGTAAWGKYPIPQDANGTPTAVNDEPTPEQLALAGQMLVRGVYFASGSTYSQVLQVIMALASGILGTNALPASGPTFNGYNSNAVLRPQDFTGEIDHCTCMLDYTFTGGPMQWATLLPALQFGNAVDADSLLPMLNFICVNSWDETWGWSDIPGIAGGLYTCDGLSVASMMSDLGIWDVQKA